MSFYAEQSPVVGWTPWVVWFGGGPGDIRPGLPESRIDGAEPRHGSEPVPFRVFGEPDASRRASAALGSVSVVFSGTLWDRDRLAAELEAGELGDRPDAWLVLTAFRRWGIDLLRRIRGVFSLMIFDGSRSSLWCARDPMGVWPLFYAEARGGLVFSTAAAALLAFPGVSGAVSRSAVAILLSNLDHRKDDTFFAAIRRLPGGHVMRCSGAERRIERYWNPVPPKLPPVGAGAEELARFEPLVDQAVGRCLQLGRPGIFLSGGLDSVTVAAMAADRCRREGRALPLALSLIYPDMQANEEPIQRGVAKALGLEQIIVDVEKILAPDGFVLPALEISRRSPAPTTTIWIPAYHRLARMARDRGCDCLFNGGGGDEWLSNSPFLVADRMRSFDFASVVQMWIVLRNTFGVPSVRLAKSLLWKYGMRPLLGSIAAQILTGIAPGILDTKRRYFRELPDWISPDRELRDEIQDHLEPTILPSEVGGLYLREVIRFLDHFLVSTEMELLFDYERQTGLPLRQPLFDPDLLEMLSRIAPELLNEAGRSKGPARQLLMRRFPELGFERQKKVQGTNYFRTVMMREGMAGWKALGGIPALSRLGVIEPRRWSLTMERIFRDNRPQELFRFWCVLSVEAWLRTQAETRGGLS